tara:strand:+ start:999 stop:1190 length:192 start_codon:yes stop_codon:yes gene_type:complete
MTAKEKAIELYNKFWDAYQHDPVAYECAVICVDEILEALEHHAWQNKDWIKYYKEVKHEINKL